MVKWFIGPRLRELAFRGSGGVYTGPNADYFTRIGFQKSVYGTSQRVKFTAQTRPGAARWTRSSQSASGKRPPQLVDQAWSGICMSVLQVGSVGDGERLGTARQVERRDRSMPCTPRRT